MYECNTSIDKLLEKRDNLQEALESILSDENSNVNDESDSAKKRMRVEIRRQLRRVNVLISMENYFLRKKD